MNKELQNRINHLLISEAEVITNALKQMDTIDKKLLIVLNKKGDYLSLLSVGDIQRHLIKNQNFNAKIFEATRKNIRIAKQDQSIVSIKKEMLAYRMEFMPIISQSGKLVDVVFWEELFSERYSLMKGKLSLPVVIMAGGKGTRLKPITNIIPKPLIPIGEKTIVEHIIETFVNCGANEFYLSVNYKHEMIEKYFKELKTTYNVHYFKEEKPLGTAGSLSLIKDKIDSTFFVSNCDILIQQDYEEVYQYHKENKNELTIIAAIKNYTIPYGTLEVLKNGLLESITEKPEHNFMVNAGMYILEPHLLNEIPNDVFFHITHLIDMIVKRNGRVGVFPINEGAWMDIGNWEEYNKTLKKLGEQPFL